MSEVSITIEQIQAIEPHPAADRLEIVKVAGTQTLTPKGLFRPGDLCVYFPPDICIPGDWAEALGVQKYLKTALYGGLRVPCRVAATRLRGVPSYGFAQTLLACFGVAQLDFRPGQDVSETFRAVKYEPPILVRGGRAGERWGGLASEPANFHRYTDIQHYRRHSHLLLAGTPVRVTEKIHGTNCRVGLLKVDDEYQFVAGSHKTARKQYDPEGRESLYWYPLQLENVLALLTTLCSSSGDPSDDVIAFGELYGPGIQDLDYGVPAGEIGWRLFDISANGRYLDWNVVRPYCRIFDVPTVPLLYEGPWDPKLADELVYGPTTVAPPERLACRFKDREGIVITPLRETYCEIGRLVLKSVSADYLDRKGGKDAGEL